MFVITTPAGGIGSDILCRVLETPSCHGEDIRAIVRGPAILYDVACTASVP